MTTFVFKKVPKDDIYNQHQARKYKNERKLKSRYYKEEQQEGCRRVPSTVEIKRQNQHLQEY